MRGVVCLSGGVDSAVSALLLKRKGYDLIGVHMVNWDRNEEGTPNCPQLADERDAENVARQLRIPFHVVNFVKEYWNEVFSEMIKHYRLGRTVVPDVYCNRHIKFDHMQRVARERFDASFIATGHYVSTSHGDYNDSNLDQPCSLLMGMDPLKDQSFFLSTLSERQLQSAIFPLGSLTKKEVKVIARENGLGTIAEKEESMGICFVGKRKHFERFLDNYIEPRIGDIVDLDNGSVIGQHRGIHHFTLGKRIHMQSSSHLGLFVAGLDVDSNIVYACEGSHHPCLYAIEFVIDQPQWIVRQPEYDSALSCRIQRSHPPIPCVLSPSPEGSLRVRPSLPLRAVANGQVCVIYRGRECLGGGEVRSVSSTLHRSKQETIIDTRLKRTG